MKYGIYHPPTLEIKRALVANSIILKTPEINAILESFYGTRNPIISDEQELQRVISSSLGYVTLSQYYNNGQDIFDQLLEPLKKFLDDLALALSMYDNTSVALNSIPIEDLMRRTPIDNIPQHQFQKLPFIYAHSFLDATAKISSTLSLMVNNKKTPLIPDNMRHKIKIVKDEFDLLFPHVKSIRNSWQHIEDRVRGKGTNEKDLGGGVLLVLSSLLNNELTYTVVDGSTQSITINKTTFELIQSFVQKTFNCFDWIEGVSR